MSSFANRARRLLINFGKLFPFILCSLIMTSYCECLITLAQERYVYYDNSYVLDTKLSFRIAEVFEYDFLTVVIALIISYAIEACVWNRLSILFIAIQLSFRHYIGQIELYPSTIVVLCVINILFSGFLTIKGIKIALK